MESMTKTFKGEMRSTIRAIELLITTKALPHSYEELITAAMKKLRPLAKTDDDKRVLLNHLRSIRTNCQGFFDVSSSKDTPEQLSVKRKIHAKKTQFQPTKDDKLKSTAFCVFIGMVEDMTESDITELMKTKKQCTRGQFFVSIKVLEIRKGGLRESKSSIANDKSYRMYSCIIRGVYHKLLIKGKKKWLFVSKDYLYDIGEK